jgi:hypothetical protein
MKRRTPFFAWALLLGAAGAAPAQQEPAYTAELQFVRELRARHYNDLALQYLERLRKGASPELARELPLETAKTRLEAAADEPDSGKRLALYEEAGKEFARFLADPANAANPRRGEAQLEAARVNNLRGRTLLSRALVQDTPEGQEAESARARAALAEAGQEVRKAAAALDAQLAARAEPRTPAERVQKKKLEADRLEAELQVGLNLFDQAQTYPKSSGKDEVLKARAAKVAEAVKVLEKLMDQDASSPTCWVARAWLGHCHDENGDPNKARARYKEILEATGAPAEAGKRLARYFNLLVIHDSPTPEEKRGNAHLGQVVEGATGWLAAYPAYGRTAEGLGVHFLLGQTLAERAGDPRFARERARLLGDARRHLREVEESDNELTDRARRLKITVIGEQQGGFKGEVAGLATFEDCYVRAQYEAMMLGEDPKSEKDPAKLEGLRKKRVATAIEALQRGLSLPDGKPDPRGRPSPEVNNARAMLAFYALNAGRYAEAAKVGEDFARGDPRSGQAAMAAAYALQACGQLLGQREREGAPEEELAALRGRMLALARYMVERWPGEAAGDMARHDIGLHLLREKNKEKDPAAAARRLGAALNEFAAIRPSYPMYAVSQYEVAKACLQADKDGTAPLPGDGPGAYRSRALAALRSVPGLAPGADPLVSHVYFAAQGTLAQLLIKEAQAAPEAEREKKFEEIERFLAGLLKKLDDPAVQLDADERRGAERKSQVESSLQDVALYATYGRADARLARGGYADVQALLDPLVKEANEGKRPELKRNPQLGAVLLGVALRADVQANKPAEARAALRALQGLSEEGGEDAAKGAASALRALAATIRQQVDELQKRGDKEGSDRAVKGFAEMLKEFAPEKLPPETRVLLAQCYSNLGDHKRAAELLEKAGGNGPQLLYARELRLGSETDKARQALNGILGSRDKPGWGARNVDVQLEDVALLEQEGKYGAAAIKADRLVKQLLPHVNKDNAQKERYFEAYYHVVYCLLKYGQAATDKGKKDEAIRRAAAQTAELEKKWPGFGPDASGRRFSDLLAKESDLKEAYEQAKAHAK